MSRNRKVQTVLVRVDVDKTGREVPIYRQSIRYVSKKELQAEDKAREDAINAQGKAIYEKALAERKAKENGENLPEGQVQESN